MNNQTRSKIAAALRSAAAKLTAAEATDVLFSINETLNPALWDENKKLKPEVKHTLQKIADDFADGFDYPLDVIDVIVTGSSANYNWNKFSDVDLHLVVDYDAIPEKYMPAFLDYADAKRKLWNQEHNIQLFGHEIEVYVQPEQDTLKAAGVYSLMKDEWLAEPKRQEPKADKATVEKKAERFHELVDAIQEMVESGEDELAYNSATILKDRIRKFRQSGLEKGGEFAAENLVFKTLRNDGTLERLDTLHKQAYDKGQSLSAAVERLELHAAPVPIFEDEGFAAIDHLHHVKDKVFSGRDLIGQTAAVRLDIPSSWAKPSGRDAVVVTIHDPSSLAPVGYDHSAVVQNATFRIRAGAARAVATGERNKTPFSYVQGTLAGAGSVGQLALPNGIPVYYDPRVVHLYVNALTGKPMKAASEVNFYYVPGNRGYFLPEIDGIYIWAKNPEYYGPGEAPGADPSHEKWGWAMTENFALTKTPSKVVMP